MSQGQAASGTSVSTSIYVNDTDETGIVDLTGTVSHVTPKLTCTGGTKSGRSTAALPKKSVSCEKKQSRTSSSKSVASVDTVRKSAVDPQHNGNVRIPRRARKRSGKDTGKCADSDNDSEHSSDNDFVAAESDIEKELEAAAALGRKDDEESDDINAETPEDSDAKSGAESDEKPPKRGVKYADAEADDEDEYMQSKASAVWP
jgi:hypothetical protein